MSTKHTTESINNIIIKSNIILVDQLKNMYDNHEFKCLICNHHWQGRPFKVKDYKCCPKCREKFYLPKPNRPLDKDRIVVLRKSKKLACILYKGGICCECGIDLTQHIYLAEFHHKDGVDKEDELCNMFTKKNLTIMSEINKCDLLCSNCHRKKHSNNDRFIIYEQTIRACAEDTLADFKRLSNMNEKIVNEKIEEPSDHPGGSPVAKK
jgi:hypothetical protein